ncbi:MAG: hypothetical protein IJ771_07400 [Clostridia bacterium]|nr:hypothetical protein [Clostridia bacterium]
MASTLASIFERVEEHGVQNPAIYDCFPKFLRDALLGTGAPMPKTTGRAIRC